MSLEPSGDLTDRVGSSYLLGNKTYGVNFYVRNSPRFCSCDSLLLFQVSIACSRSSCGEDIVMSAPIFASLSNSNQAPRPR